MADQRVLLRRASDGKEIVIAVRHGWGWRSANEDRHDLGRFLDSCDQEETIQLHYEHSRWTARDPHFKTIGMDRLKDEMLSITVLEDTE